MQLAKYKTEWIWRSPNNGYWKTTLFLKEDKFFSFWNEQSTREAQNLSSVFKMIERGIYDNYIHEVDKSNR